LTIFKDILIGTQTGRQTDKQTHIGLQSGALAHTEIVKVPEDRNWRHKGWDRKKNREENLAERKSENVIEEKSRKSRKNRTRRKTRRRWWNK